MSVLVDIEKDLGSFRLKVAFQADNCVHGLLGASGCGKSMTLRCIAGVMKPDRGRIEVDGRVLFDSEAGIDLSPQERNVGLLFQNYALFPHMTVEGNLMAVLRKKERAQARAEVADMLRRFGLEGLEHHRPAQLSGGQQQRVALARILLTRPSVLLLDEPFAALDSYLRWQTELEIEELLADFSGTTLLVTHNRGEVRRLCDTVTVLDHGFGRGELTVEELFRAPQTLSACLLSGCKNVSRAEKTGEFTLRALDWGVELTATVPVPDDLCHVGVRAHNVALADGQAENVFPCTVWRVTEDVFSAVVMLNSPGGDRGFSRLRAKLPAQVWASQADQERVELYLAPEKLMLLRPQDERNGAFAAKETDAGIL